MNRPAILCLSALLLAAHSLHSATIVRNPARGVWTLEGSPYIIEGPIFVPADTSLEIQPGVVVQLGTDDDDDWWPTLDSLIVLGEILAIGNPNQRIHFARQPGFDYGGLVDLRGSMHTFEFVDFDGLVQTNQNSRFEDCRFDRASGNTAAIVNSPGGFGNLPPVQFLRCRWQETGLTFYSGYAVVQNCTFSDGSIYVGRNSRAIVEECSTGYGRLDLELDREADCEARRSVFDGITANWISENLTVEHCLIRGDGIALDHSNGEVRILNNTFIDGAGLAFLSRVVDFAQIRNNIFYKSVVAIRYPVAVEESFPNIDYNVIFDPGVAFLNFAGGGEHNLDTDPMLQGGVPFDIRKRRGSPAINSGDPNLPRDPDGSRCDIGAIPFDNDVNLPPILTAPEYVIGRYGSDIEIVASVVDDGMFARFEVENCPEWLERVGGRLWDDTLRLAGNPLWREIPSEAIITIRAVDIDGAEVCRDVRISLWRSEIGGELQGHLSAEGSPYLITEDSWVSARDTLIVEAGVEIIYDADYWLHPQLYLQGRGVLILEGTADNPCVIRTTGGGIFSLSIGLDDGATIIARHTYFAGNIMIDGGSAYLENCRMDGVTLNSRLLTQNFRYCEFLNTYLIDYISNDSLRFEHCRFTGGGISLQLHTSWFAIDSSVFTDAGINLTGTGINTYTKISDTQFNNSSLEVEGGLRTIIRDCQFVDNEEGFTVYVAQAQASDLFIKDCAFNNCVNPVYAGAGDTIRFAGNIVENCSVDRDDFARRLVSLTAGHSIVLENEFLHNYCTPWQFFEPFPAILCVEQLNAQGNNAVIERNLFAGNAGNIVIGVDRFWNYLFENVQINRNTLVDNEGSLIVLGEQPGRCWMNIVVRCLTPGINTISDNNQSCIEGYNIFFQTVGEDNRWHGDHSRTIDPLFLGVDPFPYALRRNSPAIDAGWGGFPRDPDNSVADIGYWSYNHNNAVPSIEEDRDTLRARPGEEVTFIPRVSDEEGDSLIFRWFVEGILSGVEESLTLTTPRIGTIEVLVYVMDGNDFDSAHWVLETSFDGINDDPKMPSEYALHPIYPNPFNSRAVISFDIPEAGNIKLSLFDLQGRLVAKLIDDYAVAGKRTAAIEAEAMPSGNYIVRFDAGGKQYCQRIALIK